MAMVIMVPMVALGVETGIQHNFLLSLQYLDPLLATIQTF